MFDLDQYLERIGVSADASFAELHRAHVVSIPFENLDSHRGLTVSVEPAAIAEKLVGDERGGYCFEHNLLLKAALEARGATVAPLLARPRWGSPPGTLNSLTHLVLSVTLDGATWLADVGFGMGTLLEPIPFAAGEAHTQSGWRFRLIEEAGQLVLQTDTDDGWRDMYAISPAPVAPVDIEMANWFVCSRPESRFVHGLIVAQTLPDGTRVALSDWNGELTLSTRAVSGSSARTVERAAIASVLAEAFAMPGWDASPDGRVVAVNPA